MNKSEILQNMAIDRAMDNIAVISKDVSDLQLDMLTVREELAELKQLVKNWRKNRKGDKPQLTEVKEK